MGHDDKAQLTAENLMAGVYNLHADTPAEIERRKAVRNAIADSRIEGLPPPSVWELEIWEAYIRGEIEAKDLVDVVKQRLWDNRGI